MGGCDGRRKESEKRRKRVSRKRATRRVEVKEGHFLLETEEDHRVSSESYSSLS